MALFAFSVHACNDRRYCLEGLQCMQKVAVAKVMIIIPESYKGMWINRYWVLTIYMGNWKFQLENQIV